MVGLFPGVPVVVDVVLGVDVGAGLGVDVGEHNDDSECHVIFILFLVSMFVRLF